MTTSLKLLIRHRSAYFDSFLPVAVLWCIDVTPSGPDQERIKGTCRIRIGSFLPVGCFYRVGFATGAA